MNRKHPSLSLLSTACQRGGIAASSRRYTGDGHVIRGGEKDTLEMARFPGGFLQVHFYDYINAVKKIHKKLGQ